ncbi:MAG TPA: spherulation-specific family 4 protein [Chloroflexota bacterium]
MAVPAYFYPYPRDRYWAQLHAAGAEVELIVADPADGPGTRRDPNYVAAIEATRQGGTLLVGYVTIRYGASPVSRVIDDIERWYAMYQVDGIFVDEVSTSASHLHDCQVVHDRVKHMTAGTGLVFLNPGTRGPVDYMSACDVLVTNESTWATYRDRYFQPPDWVTGYPAHRFCHLIHGCPTEREMRIALWLARQRKAGWVFVTDHTGINAYERLPEAAYWASFLRLARREGDPRED